MQKNKISFNNKKLATTFNDYFAEIIAFLNLFNWPRNVTSLASNLDVFDSIVLKFAKFSFQQVTLVDVRKDTV